MASNKYMNAILVGLVDSFCLACEILIRGEAEAIKHIAELTHVKNLKSAQVMEKYKDDNIIKVKKGYFCVHCNKVFTTNQKVLLHLAEEGHKCNKYGRLLKRVGNAIVFQDLLVEDRAWHGFVAEMCAVCNEEFEDEAEHRNQASHAFNLAKSTFQFGDKKIYRMIDTIIFQCLTCNEIFHKQYLQRHSENEDHKKLLKKCEIAFTEFEEKQRNLALRSNGIENQDTNKLDHSRRRGINDEGSNLADGPSNETINEVIKRKDSKEDNKEILDLVATFERHELNINFINETAFCKKCFKHVDFDHKTIEYHIDEHLRNPKQRDFGYMPFQCEVNMKVNNLPAEKNNNDVSEIDIGKNSTQETEKVEVHISQKDVNDNEANESTTTKHLNDGASLNGENPTDFAKRNYLTFNKGNKDAFCRICKCRLSPTLKSMREHVAGKSHSKLSNETEMQNNTNASKPIRKVLMTKFVKESYNVVHYNLTIVNLKFCIDILSYELITKIGDRMRCHICEQSFHCYNQNNHMDSVFHKHYLLTTRVLVSYDDEFIREVRPDLFHCGFCNLMEATMEGLAIHLECLEHKQKKALYEAHLKCHLPAVLRFKADMAWRESFLFRY